MEHFSTTHFTVSIEGLKASQFTDVEGLGIFTEALSYQEGPMKVEKTRKGPTRYSDIILRRPFNGDKELVNWKSDCVKGEPKKRSGSIILHDDNHKEVMRFNFTGAWPTHWQAPSFSTKGSGQVSHEEIHLNIEHLEIG